jgi:hypothetical protein
MVDKRSVERGDRRAVPRGGRREGDQKKPWYLRRRLWLAAASLVFVGWKRLTGRAQPKEERRGRNVAA